MVRYRKLFIFLTILISGSLIPVVSSAALINIYDSNNYNGQISESQYVGSDGFTNSGDLLGIFSGNDSNQQDDLEEWLQTSGGFGGDFVIDEYFKDDYDDSEASTSGQWSTTADIMFYTVKAANAFALYLIDPVASSGTWSTYDLWIHGFGGKGGLEISHIAGYNGSPAPVPEPATMLLLGTGLAGLAGFGRRKFKK